MKGLQLILKEAVKSTMFDLTFPKAKVLNVTLMNNRIYVHHPQNEMCLIAVTKTNIERANFKFKGVIDTKILCDLNAKEQIFRICGHEWGKTLWASDSIPNKRFTFAKLVNYCAQHQINYKTI